MTPGKGTTPRGAANERQAAEYVRGMFGRVAGRYDLLNHLLSFQIDRYWRSRTVAHTKHVLQRPDALIMDLCCGTGDLLLALRSAANGKARVVGGDFCHPMLLEAQKKALQHPGLTPLLECDALSLPFADRSLDLVTVAFGFRNFTNYPGGLRELNRVLKPGGMLAILEFSTPPNPLFRGLYRFYSTRILPAIGGLVSGDSDAYTYLPESVRKFPGAEALAAEMEGAGFTRVRFTRLTFGIVALHIGVAG
ncbi:MAG: bifunctional demethylmenaquinone methyltransferase/2-methoxy-6-polyprenyl-1,4-benzoquinol methylase UbiE [Acidobacteria bacterium]|nr:bifunctional demethylmenaquinone methyltransferase/2-methoxy-6-polyprenyl-1,4-benzoquinol methylase UbiE [Acidobacteriota bacterium]